MKIVYIIYERFGDKVDLFRSEEQRENYFKEYDKALAQLDTPHIEEYVDTSYGSTHVIHCGRGIGGKIVMLHCMGFTALSWYKNLKELSEHFDIYCIDIIGEPNKTLGNTTNITFDDYMKWLLQVLDGLNIERVNIVGWSFGGFLATGFAINHPERVEKICALSPAATVAKLNFQFYLKLFPALFSGKDKRINSFLKWASGNDEIDYKNPAFAMFSEGMKSFKGWATGNKLYVYSDNDFKKMKMPYLLILGSSDPIYKKNAVNQIVKNISALNKNIKAETIDGAHGFPIQKAKEVNQRLIAFFNTR